MFAAIPLQPWEIVAWSGVYALCALAIATTFGFTLAWLAFGRKRVPVEHTQPVQNETRPAAREPEFGSTAPAM